MSDEPCTCPFPRDNCPACDHVCRACRRGLRAEVSRLREELSATKDLVVQAVIHGNDRADALVSERESYKGIAAAARQSLAEARGLLAKAAVWFEERAKQVGELKGYDMQGVPGAFGVRAALNGYAEKLCAYLAVTPVPPPPPCAGWCGGTTSMLPPQRTLWFNDGKNENPIFCTPACRDAGAPRNPVRPPCETCGGKTWVNEYCKDDWSATLSRPCPTCTPSAKP